MKKYAIVLLLLSSINYILAVNVTVENGLKQGVEYKINKSKTGGWRRLSPGESEKVSLKGFSWQVYRDVVVTWREGENVFETEKLNNLAKITFISGGRYDKVNRVGLGVRSKPVREIFLYSYKSLPDFLDEKILKKFLLPLKKIEDGIEKVKEFMKYYKEQIKKNKDLAKHYALLFKEAQNKKEVKVLTKEKELAEKRVEAYKKAKKDLQKVEQELLIREIIEKYKKRVMKKKSEGLDAKIEEDSLRMHKKMFKTETGKELPTEYLAQD